MSSVEPSLAALTGRFVSLAGRLGTTRRAPGEAVVGRIFCADPTRARALGGRQSWYCGSGRDVDRGAAAAAAVAEAFERYALRDLDNAGMVTASVAELAGQRRRHVPPARLAPVRDPGASLHAPPTDHAPIQWVHSHDLVTGEAVLLPAQYCRYVDHRSPYRPDHVERSWCIPISNGTAVGRTPAAACLSGLLELLERDAFMLMWYHRLQFPSVRIDPDSRLGRRVAGLFRPGRIDVRFIDLTEVHGVPVVIAAARGRWRERPICALGGGCALDGEAAVWKAAREVAGLYGSAREATIRGGGAALQPAQITTYGDHLRYYTDPSRHHELDFLFAGPDGAPSAPETPAPAADPPAQALRTLTRRLRARGIHAYAVELTPAGSELLGLHAYRIVSPELIPLDYHHQARHLNRERLLHEPTRRGWRPDQPTLTELNHAPHPFP